MDISAKVILFDLDGTLLLRSHSNWFKQEFIDWLIYNGVKDPESVMADSRWVQRDTRIEMLGLTLEEYITWHENFTLVEFQSYCNDLRQGKIFLAPGAHQLLQSIKTKKVLVSNSAKEWVNFAVDHFDLRKYFDYVFERENRFGAIVKPDAQLRPLIEAVIGEMSDQSIMVGDSRKDLEFALNSGLQFISVHEKIANELHYPDIPSLSESNYLA